jgi:hypothetical protein
VSLSIIEEELYKLLAGDIHWMAQRLDLPAAYEMSELRVADGPYQRILRQLARVWVEELQNSDVKPDPDGIG